MELLIIGAGGHGRAVAEVAQSLGYNHIAFLDDNQNDAVGKINDIEVFVGKFENAFVGIGNNKLRAELITRIETAGYTIPVLVHPTAYVSKTACINRGSIILPMAVVNTNTTIGAGCIISVGAVIDHNTVIGDYAHIDAGAIIKSGGSVNAFEKVESGQIVSGY